MGRRTPRTAFLVPLLMVNTGLPEVVTPFVLLGYGAGAFIGSYLGGHLGARRPYCVLFAATTGAFLVLGALCLVSAQPVLTVCLTVLLGLFGVSTPPHPHFDGGSARCRCTDPCFSAVYILPEPRNRNRVVECRTGTRVGIGRNR